jgi:hypothetical protein
VVFDRLAMAFERLKADEGRIAVSVTVAKEPGVVTVAMSGPAQKQNLPT